MPMRWSHSQRPRWPCHLAFQLGREHGGTGLSTPWRGSRSRDSCAGKNCAWTVLFSGQGDSIELVNVRTFSASRR